MPPDAALLVLPVAEHEGGVGAGRGVGVAGPELVAGAELVRGRRERRVGPGDERGHGEPAGRRARPDDPEAPVPVRAAGRCVFGTVNEQSPSRSETQVAKASGTGVVGAATPSKSWSVTPGRGLTALADGRSLPTLTVMTALLPVAGGTVSGTASAAGVDGAGVGLGRGGGRLGGRRRVGDLRQLGGEGRAADGPVALHDRVGDHLARHVGVDLDRRGRGEQAAGERLRHDDGLRVDDVPHDVGPGRGVDRDRAVEAAPSRRRRRR